MYVNKKEIILTFWTKHCVMDLKGKKSTSKACFARVIFRAC